MKGVIRSEREGSAGVVGKTIRHHSEHSEGSIAVMGKPVRRHSKRHRRICCCVEERDSNGKNRDWVSLLVYKEVAGGAGRRILDWGNDAKE